ncbi:MAG: MFS transporter [Spirochaetaceae bacterium]|nr:MAG: MFS transporter [Spirochaetaceae bacterium]
METASETVRNNASWSVAGRPTRIFFAATVTGVAILAGHRDILPVFRSHFMEYLTIGDGRFGMLFSIGAVTGLLGVLFGGRIIDRLGPRRVIRVCVTGVGAAMFIAAFGGARYAAFVLALAVSGLFTAPLAIAVTAYLGKLFPKHQRRVISLNLASTSIGGIVFPILAEALLALAAASEVVTFAHVLHVPFVITGALLVSAGFIYRAPPPVGRRLVTAATDARRRTRAGAGISARSVSLAFLIAAHGVCDVALFNWMARFLESMGEGPIAPGVIVSGYSLAYALARITVAALPDSVGRRAFLVLPGIVGGAVLSAGIVSREYVLIAGGYVVGAFFWSAEFPAMVSTLMRCERKRFGTAMATAGVITGVLSFVTMNAIGIAVQRLGAEAMWIVMVFPAGSFVMIGFGGLAWLLVFDRRPSGGQRDAALPHCRLDIQ